jgi:uncharacterized protein YdeI (YjbR/CyaY-like superfamily)
MKSATVFNARIEIIGINPFVFIPERALKFVFQVAGKDKGKIPVKIKIDGHEFSQTLIKYSGHWRLYLNTPMRKAAGKEVGDTARFEINFDSSDRTLTMHPQLAKALKENKEAAKIFATLSPSRQHEIVRYILHLKTVESVNRNIDKAIKFLMGEERFVGRDKP